MLHQNVFQVLSLLLPVSSTTVSILGIFQDVRYYPAQIFKICLLIEVKDFHKTTTLEVLSLSIYNTSCYIM